ncbi:MAG TPA: DoxX family protein [Pyrinomonadaceae bacterium]
MTFFQRIIRTKAPQATLLIRLIVGLVFLSEGVQKFLFPTEVGAGRFSKIGIPYSETAAAFVGAFEIICGLLITIGFLTRLAVIPTIAIMLVAISSTKIPILLAKGFWAMAHESRTDWSMLLGSIFLLIVGAGSLSVDYRLSTRSSSEL